MKVFLKNIILVGIMLLFAGCSQSEGEAAEGLRVPESPMLRFFERKVGKILFLSPDGNLYTINQAGEEQIQITNDGNFDLESADFRAYIHFAWSPNGDKIGIIGRDAKKYFVNTVDADGANLIENYVSADGDPIYLAWTPDSESLSFLTNQWNVTGHEVRMHFLAAEEGATVQTMGSGEAYYWVWDPEKNDRFFAHVAREEQSRVMLVSTDREQETVFQLPPGTFGTPAWSPDGNRLMMAVSEKNSEENTLVITDLQGVIQNRFASTGKSTAFSWSPDGEHVAYIASERKWGGVMGPLTVQQVDGSVEASAEAVEEKITVEDSFIFAFFWSPDSKQIAYFTLDLTTGSATSEESSGFSTLITLYALDVTSGERKNLLSFYPTLPFMEVLERFDQYQYSSSFWSPDSENFVISVGGGSSVIVVVPVSGNIEPRPIAEGLLAFWSSK